MGKNYRFYLEIISFLKFQFFFRDKFLTNLINNDPTSLHAEAYGKIIEETSVRRRMLSAANDIAKLAYQQENIVESVMDEAEKDIFGVSY